MSKYNLEKALRKELSLLNDVIDQRIIRGLSYARESRRHKFILQSLAKLRRESGAGYGWLSRQFSLV